MSAQELQVSGMTCGGCVASVQRVVRSATGHEPEVSLETGAVRLPPGADLEAAAEAIRKAGFEVTAG